MKCDEEWKCWDENEIKWQWRSTMISQVKFNNKTIHKIQGLSHQLSFLKMKEIDGKIL